jgi:hypothetical protein
MPAGFNRRRMIAVIQISALPFLSKIKFPPGSSCYQLHRFGDGIPIAVVSDNKMDVIKSDGVIEYTQPKALSRFE